MKRQEYLEAVTHIQPGFSGQEAPGHLRKLERCYQRQCCARSYRAEKNVLNFQLEEQLWEWLLLSFCLPGCLSSADCI